MLVQVFSGNQEVYETKKNTFFPPVIARYIRLHPIAWYNTATVRMEFYGCELDGKDSATVASSFSNTNLTHILSSLLLSLVSGKCHISNNLLRPRMLNAFGDGERPNWRPSYHSQLHSTQLVLWTLETFTSTAQQTGHHQCMEVQGSVPNRQLI